MATGPSCTHEDVDKLRGRVRVLAINDAYRMAPWADAIYAADLAWWQKHIDRVKPDFEGRMYSIVPGNKGELKKMLDMGLKTFRQEGIRRAGLSDRFGFLRTGGLSGYQGLGVLKHWGATVKLLLGYDMQCTGGKRHWFGDHQGLRNTADYCGYVKHFATIEGENVINLTRETALTCFPRMSVDEALQQYGR